MLAALQKTIEPRLKDSTAAARAALMESFSADGTDRRAIIANGEKVGEVGMSYASAKPAIIPGREAEALGHLRAMGLTAEVPVAGWEKHFTHVADTVVEAESGAVCDWAVWEGRRPKNAAVRGLKPEDVIAAMAPKLGGRGFAALLEGGADA